MSIAAFVLSLIGAALLALPVIARSSIEVLGPLVAPLGGGFAVMGLVTGAWAWRKRRASGHGRGVAGAALVLGVGGLVSAIAVEQALIRRDREEQARRAAAHGPDKPHKAADDDKQFDSMLKDNLGH